jgi:hypothetical protein
MEGTINNTYLIQCIVSVTDNFQSRDLVFPLCTLMGGETKANLEALQLLFDELNRFAEDAPFIHQDYLHLIVTHKADMSAGWKLTNKGGACKVKTDLCMYCPCSSDNVHGPGFHLVVIVRHCRNINIWGGGERRYGLLPLQSCG